MPDLTPTEGMREEAQRYRDWKAEGRRGGTAVAARRAGQILSGEPLSEETVITMAAWFARHEVDKQGEGFSPGEDGYPSPGRVAWAAWGGDPGQRWANERADSIKADRGIARMEDQGARPYPNEHAARLVDPEGFDRFRRQNDAGGEGVDFIYGIKGDDPVVLQAIRFDADRFTPAEARQWLEDHDHQAILFEEATGERELTPDMTVAQGMLYEALEEIADEVGQFSQADAHYMPESPFAGQGMVCSNCAFYQGPAACEVVEGEIAPGALCKHWIIPASKLSAEPEPTGRQLLSDELRRCFGSGVMRRELDVAMAPELTEDGVRFTFSSESPVARWYGEEVLSHAPGAADLSRLNNGAVHLWNHDRDVVLGVVTGAEIGADRRGVVTTRWSPNTLERGSEEWKRRQDVESAITSKVSFAYEVRDAMDMGDGKILVTKWAPLEVSTVSIPADDTVGHDRQQREYRALDDSAHNDHPPAGPDPAASPPEPQQMEPPIMDEQVSAPPETMTVETQQDARSAAEVERERIKSIGAMCRQHGMPEGMAEDLVDAGVSVDQAREQVLSKIGKRSRELQPGGLHIEADALIGMDQRDLKRYSMIKLLRHMAEPTNQALRDAAGFEIECHNAAELKADRAANGKWIPFDVVVAKRDQTVGNFGKGGALVGTELLAGSFIDLLINQSALLQSGITTLSGLTGAVDIPRKTAASQHYWVGEDVDVTPSDATFGLISSTPKTIGVRVPVSRRALIQTTPDIDTLVRQDMAERMALGVDSSGLYGTGSSGQPLGLRNVTGIGSVTLGGGASQVYPSNLGSGTHDSGDWNDYIDLRAACTAANVNVGSARYIMNAITEAGGMKTLRASAAGSDYIVSDAGTIGRHPVLVSNQVQTNDVFYGVFSDMVLATWSGLDIVVDPYTQSAKGQVIYTVMQDLDWVCRRAASFALGT
jgi:HK97 family phage major capsid protein